MLEWIDQKRLEDTQTSLAEDFASARPFRHLVLDNFLGAEQASALAASFPGEEWQGWKDASHEHQFLKRSCADISVIPEPLRTVIYELNSGPFVDWLSAVTGIPLILPDPHLIGGGLHMTGPGGTLTPHTDFHVVKGLSLYRRLNLLIYLNPDWSPEHGGELELWDKGKDSIEKKVPPTLGTAVLFQTDNDSMHGFMNPVAGRNRQSIAMYYYTAEDAETFSGDGATYWRSDSAAKGSGSKVRLLWQRSLFFLARVFSSLSWRLQGLAGRTIR